MIKNYFKIAWRSLIKNRFYSILNIAGLSIGIAVSLLLLFYVKEEMSFDQFYSNAENIYRVGINVEYDDTKEKWAAVPNISGPTFKENISAVIDQVRFLRHDFGEKANLNINGKNYLENNLYWVDSTVINIFDVNLIHGNPETALNEPNKIIISQSRANKIFGLLNPIGESIKIDNNLELIITGVYENFPSNATLDCEMIASFSSLKWAAQKLTWDNSSFETFLLTQPGTIPEELNISMNKVLNSAIKKEDQWFSFFSQPMLDVHLFSHDLVEKGYSAKVGNYTQIKIMGWLALAVLLLACFNYINMATARSQQRFREVGINKTLGATNFQMIRRFMVETGMLVAISLILGIVIIQLCTPFAESLTGQALNTSELFTLEWISIMVGTGLLITFFAGLYPALFLSNFTPKKLLSPLKSGASSNQFFRQTLVIGQFSVCISLIIGVLIFNQQLKYIGQKNLGFKADQVLAINTFSGRNSPEVEGLINAYRSLPEIKKVTRVQGYPGIEVSGYSLNKLRDESKSIGIQSNHVSKGFDQILELKYIAGKTLPSKAPEDTTIQVVMNEAALKFIGWTPEEAIGKTPPGLYYRNTEIVGVVEDFHFESFHNPIGAYVFTNGNTLGNMPYLLVKLNSAELGNTLDKLKTTYNKHLPNAAFEYDFLSDQTARLYASETRMSKIISVFTFLTILISCLGLFGLAAFTTERRIKEIGIRKVLGASVSGIVGLLSKDFLKPVFLALFIASPIAYLLMNKWLQNFAYRVEVQWWVFLVAGFLAIVLAFFTVSFQSIKAALKSPVDSISND